MGENIAGSMDDSIYYEKLSRTWFSSFVKLTALWAFVFAALNSYMEPKGSCGVIDGGQMSHKSQKSHIRESKTGRTFTTHF
jgi:hypothetical protein